MLDVQNRLPTPGKENRVKITKDDGSTVEGVLSYADEATQDGTFWNRKNGQLLQGDIRELTIKDGESISAGDVVNVDDGVYHDVTPQANVENVIYNIAVTNTHLASFGEKAYLCVDYGPTSRNVQLSRLNDSYSANKASVMLANGVSTAQSYGLQAMGTESISVSFESNGSHYVRFYAYSESNGSFTQTKSYSVSNAGPLCRLSDNSVLHIRNTSGLMVEVISTSQKYSETKLPNNTGANYISACKLPDDSNGNKRVCICFADTNDGNKGKAVIATIDSSNAVTFGTVKTIENSAVTATACATDGNSIVFNTSDSLILTDLSLNTLDTETSTAGDVTNVSAYTYSFLGTNNNAMVIKTNGGTISKGEAYAINSGSNTNYPSLAATSENGVIAAYSDASNSNYGTTTVLEVLGNQIAGSFLDNSKDAIALASGNGGDIIPVGFGGYCQCDGVTEGQEIISDGVSAFSPLDGWLYVVSNGIKSVGIGARMQIVSYVGTGTYGANNKTSITFDFVPKIIFVYGNIKSNFTKYRAVIFPTGNGFGTVDGQNDMIDFYNIRAELNSTTVDWYSPVNTAKNQLNELGSGYEAVAFG